MGVAVAAEQLVAAVARAVLALEQRVPARLGLVRPALVRPAAAPQVAVPARPVLIQLCSRNSRLRRRLKVAADAAVAAAVAARR